ncbi:hypothetical protein HDU96_001624 [Phlyctochytrium bullatum]|nr:hypothetical protein HDU96_001624 [Phlyctochytrium bullatum]
MVVALAEQLALGAGGVGETDQDVKYYFEGRLPVLWVCVALLGVDFSMTSLAMTAPVIKTNNRIISMPNKGISVRAKRAISILVARTFFMALFFFFISPGAVNVLLLVYFMGFASVPANLVGNFLFRPAEGTIRQNLGTILKASFAASIASNVTGTAYWLTFAATSLNVGMGGELLKGTLYSTIRIVAISKSKERFYRDPTIMHREEIIQLSFTAIPHIFSSYYYVPIWYVAFMAPQESFFSYSATSIVIDVIFRLFTNRYRRKVRMLKILNTRREMEDAIGALKEPSAGALIKVTTDSQGAGAPGGSGRAHVAAVQESMTDLPLPTPPPNAAVTRPTASKKLKRVATEKSPRRNLKPAADEQLFSKSASNVERTSGSLLKLKQDIAQGEITADDNSPRESAVLNTSTDNSHLGAELSILNSDYHSNLKAQAAELRRKASTRTFASSATSGGDSIGEKSSKKRNISVVSRRHSMVRTSVFQPPPMEDDEELKELEERFLSSHALNVTPGAVSPILTAPLRQIDKISDRATEVVARTSMNMAKYLRTGITQKKNVNPELSVKDSSSGRSHGSLLIPDSPSPVDPPRRLTNPSIDWNREVSAANTSHRPSINIVTGDEPAQTSSRSSRSSPRIGRKITSEKPPPASNADPNLELRNFLLDEAIAFVSETVGNYISIAITTIVGVTIFAKDAMFPYEGDKHKCSNGLTALDFVIRAAQVMAIRLLADAFLVFAGRSYGLPYHLAVIRFSMAQVLGVAFLAAAHACLLVVAFRGAAHYVNPSVETCLPARLYRS